MVAAKVAICARFRSDNQREESIDAQIRAIEEYCEKNNIKIVKHSSIGLSRLHQIKDLNF
ncbi:recombinase family protein [Clostridioides difficile]|uniref:recombinase family protein n=1 Tax=Clostridioides difficile TaxID=1496 RepID=UPI00098007BE|nr:recombinase family protein [Clostridioides difficile]MCK8754293.1 recombinase family protein [Clostridioides difficile]MDL0353370.1 recombinase family protein [Clostridioides difficile]SJQ21708.1 Uncharacterised protein [Clostridioides difficile]